MSIYRVLIFTIVFLAGSPVFAQDYEIRLESAVKEGDKYEVNVSGELSEQMTSSSQGQVLGDKQSSFSATFEGTTTVLKVDELQRTAELKLLVSKCHKRMNGNTTDEEVLAKGTQVVMRRSDSNTEFLVDGKVVPKDIEKVLGVLFSLPQSKATDDDIFGTKDRKKVGDSWAMNSAKAANELPSAGLKADATDIKGSTKIEKVVTVHGTKCLRLSGKMEINKITPELPAGMIVEMSNVSTSFSGDFPIDSRIGRLVSKSTMKITFVAKGKPAPGAPEITLSMKHSKSRQIKRKFLKVEKMPVTKSKPTISE